MDEDRARRIRDLVLGVAAGEGARPDLTRLAAIAPILSPRLAGHAVSIAQRDDNASRRAYVIGALARRLGSKARTEAIRSALSDLGDHPPRAASAIATLAPELPSEVCGDAVRAAIGISPGKWRGIALAELAPYLDEASLVRAIDAVAALDDPWDLTAAIVAIAPSVPERLLRPLRDATLRIDHPYLRRLAVHALDTQWEKVADRPAELRRLLEIVPTPQRDVLEERLVPWLEAPSAPGAAPAMVHPLQIELQSLTEGLDPADVERAIDDALRDFLFSVDTPTTKTRGKKRGKPPPANGDLPRVVDDVPPHLPEHVRIRPSNGDSPRVVNTGFVDAADPTTSLHGATLGCGRRCYFWLDVGRARDDSIEQEPLSLPAPPGAELRVVVFGFPGELVVQRGGLSGDLRLEDDGGAVVIRPASRPSKLLKDALRRRLYFAVRTPTEPGTYTLRCSIYHRQNLLQSRVVSARVTAEPEVAAYALSSRVDYAIARRLDSAHLTRLAEQRLSVMLNDAGSGTHGLRFVGQQNFVNDATIDEGVLKTSVDVVRGALRQVAWGSPDLWESGKQFTYRYDKDGTAAQLAADLISLAIRGAKLHFELGRRLAGGVDRRNELAQLMRQPGAVQIALKQGAGHVLPAALFYDHPIDTQKDHTLCAAFAAALAGAAPISDGECLQGRCPSWGNETVVCPSGFWGYRHCLGLPLTVADGDDAPTDIAYGPGIALAMCVATDLEDEAAHEAVIKGMPARAGLNLVHVAERDEALQVLGEHPFQVVYFYCHGGYTQDGFPTLVIGKGGPAIAAENLAKIRWTSPRPLVVLNGCHTAALTPETMLGMVGAFVEESGAAGVIGTEITIFESLARPFAETCLGAFLAGAEIGEAVRRARLELLQRHHNPLGLVYIPYVSTGVHLVERR